MKIKVIIGGVDYSKYVQVPLQIKQVLDETLDIATLNLLYTDKKDPFEPFTLVEIIIRYEQEKKYKMFVSADNIEEILSTGKVNHSLTLIEETKEAERILLTKTVTKPLSKVIEFETSSAKEKIQTSKESLLENYISNPYKTPLKTGEFLIEGIGKIFNTSVLESYYGIVKVINVSTGEEVYSSVFVEDNKTINIDKSGNYEVQYWLQGRKAWAEEWIRINYQIRFENEDAKAVEKSITNVVNAILQTCETIREGESPRFKFNKEQAQHYLKINCPEMAFTNQTLWEALRQVGGVIHAMPRFKDNVLYFDSYNKSSYSNIKDKKCISSTGTHSIEQFCSTIQSSVDNLIASENASYGTIKEYGGILKTPRTEATEVQITEDNCYIETIFPIGKIISLECGYVGDTYVGEISQFVKEKTEYDVLSDFTEAQDTSKAFALYYELGTKHIKGLNSKAFHIISDVFNSYAINNIINKVAGVRASNIMKLQFRVTYQPYYSATLRQVKPKLKDLKFKSVLSYTQGANSLSVQAYGENLKGAVARLGNAEKRKVYLLKNIGDVAYVGEKFDKDYRISEVNCEYYNDYILCEVGLSKKFNKWSEFVGVNQELRVYEVSEKLVAERTVIWEDYAVVQKQTENKLQTSINMDSVEHNINRAIPVGDNYILGNNRIINNVYTTNYYGTLNNWEQLDTSGLIGYYASAIDVYNGNDIIITFSDYFPNSRGLLYYSDDEGRKIQEINLSYDYGVSSVTTCDNKFVVVYRNELVTDGDDTFFIVSQGQDEEGNMQWTKPQVLGDSNIGRLWKAVSMSRTYQGEEVEVLIAMGGMTGQIKYNIDLLYESSGNLVWENQDYSTLTPLEYLINAKTFDEKPQQVYFYNSSKIMHGTVVSDNELFLNWKEFSFPVNNIIDFGFFDGLYIAINSEKVFYSSDMLEWQEFSPNIENISGMAIGEELLIFNNSNNIYSIKFYGNNSFVNGSAVAKYSQVLSGLPPITDALGGGGITLANIKTFNSFGEQISDYWLPTVSSAIGNTFQIQFEYVDNFSAGSKVVTEDGRRLQQFSEYGDVFGEFETMEVSMYTSGAVEINNDYVAAGDNLPEINRDIKSEMCYLSSKTKAVANSNNNLLIKKDNREKIKFSYCLHYVSNEDNLIIGSGLSKINPFANLSVKGALDRELKVYILKDELTDFQSLINIENAIYQRTISTDYDRKFCKIRFNISGTMVADGKAWAVVAKNPYNQDENLLMFGKNIEFKQGDNADDVFGGYEIAFTHDVHEFL